MAILLRMIFFILSFEKTFVNVAGTKFRRKNLQSFHSKLRLAYVGRDPVSYSEAPLRPLPDSVRHTPEGTRCQLISFVNQLYGVVPVEPLVFPVFDRRPHPYRMHPPTKGLSHGLKKCPPDTFLPALRSGRPFESFFRCTKKEDALRHPLFWYTGRDSNPQPSEPESDALSIEPPVHLLFS